MSYDLDQFRMHCDKVALLSEECAEQWAKYLVTHDRAHETAYDEAKVELLNMLTEMEGFFETVLRVKQ